MFKIGCGFIEEGCEFCKTYVCDYREAGNKIINGVPQPAYEVTLKFTSAINFTFLSFYNYIANVILIMIITLIILMIFKIYLSYLQNILVGATFIEIKTLYKIKSEMDVMIIKDLKHFYRHVLILIINT